MSYNKKQQRNTKTVKKNYFLIPLILTSFIPLVVYYHEYDSKLTSYPWFGDNSSSDFFLYWKMILFTIIGVVMACVLAYKISADKQLRRSYSSLKLNAIWIPLLLYGILCLLSTVFSEHSYFGYHGMAEQMESLWVLLSYCILTYYTFIFVETEEDVHITIKWILIGAAILCGIGMFQAFSLDFYRSPFGKLLYLPKELRAPGAVDFSFEPGRVYTSLYNPNYVGAYASLFIPLLIILILFNKNRKMLLVYIPLSVATIICLFGAKSKSGLIAIVFSLLFMAVLFRKAIAKNWKYFTATLVILCISFFIYNAKTDNTFINSLKDSLLNVSNVELPLNQIQTNDDNIMVEYNHEKLYFSFNPNGQDITAQLVLTDEKKQPIAVAVQEDGATLAITDERFPGFLVSAVLMEEKLYFDININGQDWYFTNQLGDNTYYYLTNTGKTCKMNNPETAIFDSEHERIASGRGYIWSRTIPLLKDTILFGTGADTFALAFPNDDFVGRYNNGYLTSLITKPHNLYLQIGVQTGVLSLLAFLAFYLIYFISSIKLYFRHSLDSFLSQLGAGILVGTLAYMIAGLSNDSSVTFAPIFWMLMGLGIAVNSIIKKQENNA